MSLIFTMSKVCCLKGCPDISVHKELYRLPSDYPSKQAWLAKIRDKIDYSCYECNGNLIFVCHLHFRTKDFVFNLDGDVITTKHLAPNACPSVFPQNTEEWQTNLTSHLLLENASNLSSSNSCLNDNAIPEENGESLGNIESLLNTLPETEIQTDAASPLKQAKFVSPTKNQFQPTSIVRLGTSPSLPSRLNYSCTNCDFKTTDVMLLKDHRKEKHSNGKNEERRINSVKPLRTNESAREIMPADQAKVSQPLEPIDEDDVQYACVDCNYTTPNIRAFREHQRTHELAGSSTEELSDDENPEEGCDGINIGNESRANWSLPCTDSGDTKPCEGTVYRCPICKFWAQSVINFHSHLVVSHNMPGNFKCSRCEFTSTKRRSVTKHIDQQQKENKDHGDAGWVMLTDVGNFNYSHYLKPAKSLSPEKSISSGTGFSITQHSKIRAVKQAHSELKNVKTDDKASILCISSKKDQHSLNETNAPEIKNEDSPINEAAGSHAQGDAPTEEKTHWRELVRHYRRGKKAMSKLNDKMQSTQKKLEELALSKKRNEADEKALLEQKGAIRERSEDLKTKKLKAEFELRTHQCQFLNHQLTLLKSSDVQEMERAQAAILENEKTRFELEDRLRSVEQEVEEVERQEQVIVEQFKEITESNASIEQLMNITRSELNDYESQYRTLYEELAILDKRTRIAICKERSRIRTSSTVLRAKAARNYKRTLLLLQNKERKRLSRLDEIMEIV